MHTSKKPLLPPYAENFRVFTPGDIPSFRKKLLSYCKKKDVYCLLDSNGFYKKQPDSDRPYYHTYDLIAGIGSAATLQTKFGNAFEELRAFREAYPGWLFGYLGYDLKNELEKLSSSNPDHPLLDDMFLFVPMHVILIINQEVHITSPDAEKLFEEIMTEKDLYTAQSSISQQSIQLKPRMSRDYYLDAVQKIRKHIEEGDVYELNLCQEFYAENVLLDSERLFIDLTYSSPQPFSALVKNRDKYIISASMERFLKKEGRKIVSQPIKGTIRRGHTPDEDQELQNILHHDEKERAENVMIVDLVRNDLAKTATPGSVQVEELFGIYEFPFVHHMISTVSAEMADEFEWQDVIKSGFPMGSMTGAPKVMAMELIEKYELSKRGAFSGAIGYITPEDDLDLNVVIRSFVYNSSKQYLSLHVGSAITYDSLAEKEYEECLVKISGLRQVLEK